MTLKFVFKLYMNSLSLTKNI